MTRQRIRVDCIPESVRSWRLECVDDSIWITFAEGVPRPLGAAGEVMPVLRRFLERMSEGDAVAVSD